MCVCVCVCVCVCAEVWGDVALKGDLQVHNSGQHFVAAGLNGVFPQTHLFQGGQATQLVNTQSCNLIGGEV